MWNRLPSATDGSSHILPEKKRNVYCICWRHPDDRIMNYRLERKTCDLLPRGWRAKIRVGLFKHAAEAPAYVNIPRPTISLRSTCYGQIYFRIKPHTILRWCCTPSITPTIEPSIAARYIHLRRSRPSKMIQRTCDPPPTSSLVQLDCAFRLNTSYLVIVRYRAILNKCRLS